MGRRKREPERVVEPASPMELFALPIEEMPTLPIRLDPDHPNVQRLAKVVSDIAWRYVTTHTAEECEDLLRRVERKRQIRNRMFGPPQPMVTWEMMRDRIEKFGLSATTPYELDDPC